MNTGMIHSPILLILKCLKNFSVQTTAFHKPNIPNKWLRKVNSSTHNYKWYKSGPQVTSTGRFQGLLIHGKSPKLLHILFLSLHLPCEGQMIPNKICIVPHSVLNQWFFSWSCASVSNQVLSTAQLKVTASSRVWKNWCPSPTKLV